MAMWINRETDGELSTPLAASEILGWKNSGIDLDLDSASEDPGVLVDMDQVDINMTDLASYQIDGDREFAANKPMPGWTLEEEADLIRTVRGSQPIDRLAYTYWDIRKIPVNKLLEKNPEVFNRLMHTVENAKTKDQVVEAARRLDTLTWVQRPVFKQAYMRRIRQMEAA
jgi:hypothetical protein